MEQRGFRFTPKEVAVLIIGTALALGSFRSDDPWLVVSMLILSWGAFVYICAFHEGSPRARWASALAITAILAAISIRLFWAAVSEGLDTFRAWISGPHGHWFDRFTGALFLILFAVLAGTVWMPLKKWLLSLRVKAPKGVLDYQLDIDNAMRDLPPIAARLLEVVASVAPLIDKHSAALEHVHTTGQRLRVAKNAAATLDRCSRRLDRIMVEFSEQMELLAEGLNGWSQWLERAHPSKASVVNAEGITNFRDILITTNDKLCGYMSTITKTKGLASTLNAAIDRHLQSVGTIVDTYSRLRVSCEEALKIIDGLS
jgi:hypothetical protein